ncbi:hypothetical protein SAMN05216436_102127 [bacterium A37T11]|nr:hypothetical protein SAMN05216436_102127 [bacterium A37T11]
MANRIAQGGFKQFRDNDLLNQGGTIVTAMTGNANFPNPVPALADVQAAVEDFRVKLEASSRKGSPLETALKNESREALVKLLKQLAFYVNTVADGSLSLVLSSGFPVTSLPSKPSVPPIPTRIKLSDWIQSGQVRLNFDSMPGAWMYEYTFTKDLDEQGTPIYSNSFTTTKSSGNVLAPLMPGLTYYIKVRSRNGQGVSDWTTPESIIAR